MSVAIVKAVTGANRGRGAALLDLIKRGLANADKYVSGLDYNRGAQILLGNDANVQRSLRRGTAKALEAGMGIANKTPFYSATPEAIREAAYRTALGPTSSNILRAAPATAALGTLALGGAAVDAVTESEDERNLRLALELLQQRGYS